MISTKTFSSIAVLALLFASCLRTEADCHERGRPCGDDSGGQSSGNGGSVATAGGGSGGGSDAGGTAGSAGNGGADAGGVGGNGGFAAGSGGVSGGEGGDAGCGGEGGRVPCDGTCVGSTPICKIATDTCVECTTSTHCTGAKRACDTMSNICVECTRSSDCSGEKSRCDMETNVCVACLTNSHCSSATASLCTAGACAPCTSNDDCTHISGKGVCDAGECVRCTGTEYGACGEEEGVPLVCDSLERICTTSKEHSAGLCKTCVSDAQCSKGQICVEETFGMPPKAVGFVCSWKQGDDANGAPNDCFSEGQPYAGVQLDAVSIDGSVADICILSVSTCAARNQFRDKDCGSSGSGNDELCGFDPPNDAKCDQVGVSANYRCTMRCGSDVDCPPSFSCNIGAPQPFCEL